MVIAKKYVYRHRFVGEPKRSDLEIVEEELPDLKNGEFLCEAVIHSVDPYMRPYMARFSIGVTMIGTQIAKIVESKNDKWPVGRHVFGDFGWRTHTISDGKMDFFNLRLLPEMSDIPLSYALSLVGMPGATAYFGFLELCQPKKGETVVVSGAAGAVGSIVGQIAKIKGCYVVGIAGSDEKCKWLLELGFDEAVNYKNGNLLKELAAKVPKGVDCYFDNVAGEISTIVRSLMNEFGRISVCGAISHYNADLSNPDTLPVSKAVEPSMIFKQLRMEGFVVTRWTNRWDEFLEQQVRWIREGKLKYRETRTKGFDKLFDAFVGMLNGENIGKAVVDV